MKVKERLEAWASDGVSSCGSPKPSGSHSTPVTEALSAPAHFKDEETEESKVHCPTLMRLVSDGTQELTRNSEWSERRARAGTAKPEGGKPLPGDVLVPSSGSVRSVPKSPPSVSGLQSYFRTIHMACNRTSSGEGGYGPQPCRSWDPW